MNSPVFASALSAYYTAGWRGILPVPPAEKFPPPTGFTGADGIDTSPEQLTAWSEGVYADYSIALRLPAGVIGLDVDHYTKVVPGESGAADREVVKNGADVLAGYEASWGVLPATWISTARGSETGPGPSGIRLFRVPAGRYGTHLGGSIEVIQRHHRYVVVAPSIHRDLAEGARYRWYDPGGGLAGDGVVPGPAGLTELPARWVAELGALATEASAAAADPGSGWQLLCALRADERVACSDVAGATQVAVLELGKAESGSRHDVMTARTHNVVQLGASGHPGVGVALEILRELWEELTSGEGRAHEFESMLLSSARKAVTAVGASSPVDRDPCLTLGGYDTVQAPAPIDDRGEFDPSGERYEPLPGPITAPIDYGWRQVIGAELFDPQCDTDHKIAKAVLYRCRPMIRHASDTRNGWLQRGPLCWELHGDALPGRAVEEIVELMPAGDPELPTKKTEYTVAHRQFARRTRMENNAGANAVAASMRRTVAGGIHPSAVKLADLDSDPEILWAGGMPYDLRASGDGPALTDVGDKIVHLSSAGVMPEIMPTPHWDALLVAVWPDAAIRAWVLRVLSISVTGYPDAALPILLGPAGTGKTSVITLIMSCLGTYGHAANPKLLSGDNSHDSIIFALKGRRLSFIDEAPSDAKGPQERLKRYSGGGELTGNAMNQNPITFRPTHTLILTANHKPSLVDAAVRRRARLIPCEGAPQVVETVRRALTPAVWAGEAPGVLAFLMAEAAAWLADPNSALTSAAPPGIRFQAEEIAEEQDPVKQWVDDACEPWEAGTRSGTLHDAFIGWCRNHNVAKNLHLEITKWGVRLNELNYPATDRRDGRYRALRIRVDGGHGFFDSVPGGPGTASSPGAPISAEVAAHQARQTGITPNVEGPWRVGGGSSAQPSTPENPSSPPVFSSSVEGVEGLQTTNTQEVEEEEVRIPHAPYMAPICDDPPPSTVDHKNAASPAKTRISEPSTPAETLHTEADLAENTAVDLRKCADAGAALPDGLPEGYSPLRNVTPHQVTVWANTRGISKVDARAELKTLKAKVKVAEKLAMCRAGIDAAAGEYIGLPAGVDRGGHAVQLTEVQVLKVVRDCLARTGGALTVDIENTGYPVGHALYALRTIQLGDDEAAVVLDAQDPAQTALVATLLAEATFLHAHSATADLVPLVAAELIELESAWDRMHDTVIPAKLGDPQSTGSDPGLKKLADAVLGTRSVAPGAGEGRAALFKAAGWLTDTKIETPVERSGWAQCDYTRSTMIRYAASDVLDTHAVARELPIADPKIVYRERLAQRMTARVAHHGVRLDAEHIAAKLAEHRPAQAAARERVATFGIENAGSSKQVAAVMVELGATLPLSKKTGAPSVAKEVLEPLAELDQGAVGDVARAVLDYRHHSTVIGTFLEPMTQLCERGDGRVRPTVYTLGTVTGRMSCVRLNLQQLSRQGGVRACITADPGQLMIGADFSGVELRVAAALSGDTTLRQFLAEGRDLHAEIALQVFGACPKASEVSEKNPTGEPTPKKEHRYVAKRIVFGRLYGGGIPTLAAQGGTTHAVAQAAVDTLDAMTPGLTAWSADIRNAIKAGHVAYPSYSGRIIHFDPRLPHKGPNAAIQGSARELLVDALIRWGDTRWGRCVLLPVHDELDVFVPAEDAVEATSALVAAMETQMNGISIIAEPSAPAFAWADAA